MTEISCLLVSHNKPDYCYEAIESVLNQTHTNWELLVMDSGILFSQGYFTKYTDSRIKIIPSGETLDTRRTKAMAPWCFNECFRRKLVTGNLVVYLTDDDIWYSNAFAVFVKYCQEHPEINAMYASQDLAIHNKDGRYIAGERRAIEIMGQGKLMCCVVDYCQFCHTLRILDRLNDYWPEEKATETYADGVFMDRIGAITKVYPIDIKVSQNRRTLVSTYNPSR